MTSCPIALLCAALTTLLMAQPRATIPTDHAEDAQIRQELEQLRWRMPARIVGRVTDAETAQPVERFTVIPGLQMKLPNGRLQRSFDYDQAQEFTGGAYEWRNPGRQPDVIVRIEASGYEPVVSGALSDQLVAPFDAKLKRATNVRGQVLAPDGAPAAGATVLLATADVSIDIHNDNPEGAARQGPRAKTDERGHFELPPPGEPFRLLVLHDSGSIERGVEALAQGEPLRLEPYARIEGTLRIGSKPAADQRVMAHPVSLPNQREMRIARAFSATTDAHGRFTLQRVPGVPLVIWRQVVMRGPVDGRLYGRTASTNLTPNPGETLRIELGGVGRPVVGKVVRKGGIPEDWFAYPATIRPAVRTDANDPRAAAWFDVKPDGSFRLDDVLPGEYRLTINFAQPSQSTYIGGTIASVESTFTVPEIPGGQSDVPLDLGELAVKE